MDYQNYNPRLAALTEARTLLTDAAKAAMAEGTLPQADLPDFIVEIPADVKNGDVASNLAMAGARVFHKAPRQIAEAITAKLDLNGTLFAGVDIAGPGFINLFLGQDWFTSVLRAACANPEYGRTDAGAGKRYNVEFVSANPTGPMHMGNARGGALGDCLAACLDWAGYDVTREFYINDAGNQIEKFGKSLAIRYLQLYKGEEACPLPAECYQGADIIQRAKEFAEVHGDAYVNADFEELKKAIVADALPKNIAGLQRDLGKYRIQYDVWFHESDLHKSGAVQAVVDKLLETGACYKAEDGAIMYRSAQYAAKYGVANKRKTEDGSEEEAKDEVLVRANGIPTYFAADIAYHYNKLAVRGFDKAIDVWGADHHGHVARMKGAMDAIGLHGEQLDVVLMQMVNLMRDGKPVRMSKRTGKAITLTDLLDEVPIDSARFFFNQRESSSTLDFDLDLAVRNDSENPVYYVQYAHARICSLLKKLEEQGVAFQGVDSIDASVLTDPSEQALIRLLAAFPAEIVAAADKYDPARITRYCIDVATAFHRFYNACRILDAEGAVQQNRIALSLAVRGVIHNILTMFKVNAPESM
ncbi:arginine--tRNA ligase [Subdoligranulum variabile]|uniref:Arginine--tRNA ligase n=1 Tax=Subdoligranulum variabile DSM 15176 TaxID=411471 RepID=D1PPX9_9FIRM|nr:arginine--tRNA ligase [Subdoligranulum variabile]EFB75325.1 arginine--tRNA ligase [Subdoligranulum variabile DSM 15176]UWP69226.1 arginine--tRNA ligase [Subdoligranulum variabile]